MEEKKLTLSLHQAGVEANSALMEVGRATSTQGMTADTRDNIFGMAARVVDGVFNNKPIKLGKYDLPSGFTQVALKHYEPEVDQHLVQSVLGLLSAGRALSDSEALTVQSLTTPLKRAIKAATFGRD